MEKVFDWLMAFGIIGLQYFLSRRQKVFWGAILPIAFIILTIVLLSFNSFNGWVSMIFPAILGLLILCGIWSNAREDLKKKRLKELEKMQAQDL